jgi:hypothetical protein
MSFDPIIEEIHKIREQHAAEFGFNKDLIFAYWLNKSKDANRVYVNFENIPQNIKHKKTVLN